MNNVKRVNEMNPSRDSKESISSRADKNRQIALERLAKRNSLDSSVIKSPNLSNPNLFRIPAEKNAGNRTFTPVFKNKSTDILLSPTKVNGNKIGSYSPKFNKKNINSPSSNSSEKNIPVSYSPKFKKKDTLMSPIIPDEIDHTVKKQLFSPSSSCIRGPNNDSLAYQPENNQASTSDLLLREQIEKKRQMAINKLKSKHVNSPSTINNNSININEVKSTPAVKQNISMNINEMKATPVKQNYSEILLTMSIKNDIWFQVSHDRKFSNILRPLAQKIPNRSYNAKEGFWLFHINNYQEVVSLLTKELPGVEIVDIPHKIIKAFQDANKKCGEKVELTNIDNKLLEKLMPFQKEGIKFGIKHDGRVLIGDDMGLGKTIEAIALCSYYKDNWPILVICPSSIKTSWSQHFLTWIPTLSISDVKIIHTSKDDVSSEKVLIISYDLATKLTNAIQRRNFQIVVADESHFLKNHQAARTKSLVPIIQNARRAILLSGTPALSRPKELYMQVKAIRANLFPKYKEFSIRYCDGKEGRFGWEDNGCTNSDELNYLLKSTVMIRRLKDDVLDQLPEKRRQIVVLDESLVKHTKQLKYSENSFISSSKKEKRNSLMQYYDCTCDAKIKGVCEYVGEQLESGKKILVFAHHLKMLDAIEVMVKRKKIGYIRIDGRTNSKNRQVLVDEFTASPQCLLGILSITAAGTGLNITASSFVIFAELYWNPGHLIQAEDRAYRYGQKNAVLITYVVARKTADDYIWPMVSSKLKVLSELGVGMSKDLRGSTSTYLDPNQRQINAFFEELNELEMSDIDNSNEPATKKQKIT